MFNPGAFAAASARVIRSDVPKRFFLFVWSVSLSLPFTTSAAVAEGGGGAIGGGGGSGILVWGGIDDPGIHIVILLLRPRSCLKRQRKDFFV